jgi:lactate dehydrogenase-like 2-hydroxyacid dehydrogenase
MADVVLVTENEFAKAEHVFSRANNHNFVSAPADEAGLADAVTRGRARVVIVGVQPYTGALYRALKEVAAGQVSLIVRFGVGHDGVNKSLAHANNIVVCNTPGMLDVSVAEHAFWLMGNLARQVTQLDCRLRAGQFTGATGSELHGKLLGVLGFGPIGRRVARMAHFGFGMRVRALGASGVEQLQVRERRSLAEIQAAFGLEHYTNDTNSLLRECDFVSIHLPATPDTRHFINASRLELFKPGALLVNTARGSVVDEAALYEALRNDRLAGAALDVFAREPYEPVAPGKDLRGLANVLLTPHIGSNTREANQRMAEACLANVTHFFAGNLDRLTQVKPMR